MVLGKPFSKNFIFTLYHSFLVTHSIIYYSVDEQEFRWRLQFQRYDFILPQGPKKP